MRPDDAAHELKKALKESEEFKEVKEAQKALKADENAKKMLLDFRDKQMKLYKQKLSGLEVSQEQEDNLQKLIEVVNMNLVAKRYLQAEYKAVLLIQDVHKIINEATEEIYDKELFFLPDEDDNDQH